MRRLPTVEPDLVLVALDRYEDHRGSFTALWERDAFAGLGVDPSLVQVSVSSSRLGTLRGLHFQRPRPQGKLIVVLHGEIFDVVVDLRRGSPRFGRWSGLTLRADEPQALWVPPGFAHGFLSLHEDTLVQYAVDAPYAVDCEHVLAWNDPELAISWPVPPGVEPRISARDQAGRSFAALSAWDLTPHAV